MNVKMETAGLPTFQTLARAERIERSVSVALAGCGRRGEELLDALARVPGVSVAAVADIWPYRREVAQGRQRARRLSCRTYETLAELLAAEGGRVDAVVVATPDWQHANHVTACLEAGRHVYCEGELADSAESARRVVRLARAKRLLVQGGHQRRSNPRYVHAFETACRAGQALGRATHAYAQWHRAEGAFRRMPARLALPAAELERHGYADMEQLLNWEWFRRYGPGGVAARAGHKLDLLRWFCRAEPASVSAVGGSDCLGRETPDCLMALFTFRLASGDALRGYVQILSGQRRGGSYEQFMGEYATLTIAETAACGNAVQPEEKGLLANPDLRKARWDPLVSSRVILPRRELPELEKKGGSQVAVDARVSPEAPGWPLPVTLDRPPCQPHLENFVAAIRDEAVLAEPAELAYANWVGVEGALRSLRERRPVDFAPQDFAV